MNLALNEANDIQRRIDAINDKIAKVPLVEKDKHLEDVFEVLKLAVKCLERQYNDAEMELYSDVNKKAHVRNEVINELVAERTVLERARDAVLSPNNTLLSSTATWTPV